MDKHLMTIYVRSTESIFSGRKSASLGLKFMAGVGELEPGT